MQSQAPLAHSMRPKNLEHFLGQQHILAPGMPLRLAIEQDQLQSLILGGPPGSGKTTLAHIIANRTKASFVQLNAVLHGVQDLRKVCAAAQSAARNGERTVLFIDEIHRFNSAQQDALLPFVEQGTVILVGATTQNPYFAVNAALVSRSRVVLLHALCEEEIICLLHSALGSPEGLDGAFSVEEGALQHIAHLANGDARVALNLLELASLTCGKRMTLAQAHKLLTEKNKRYDKDGEDHYNMLSAFIKTLRGSDPDAALLWMFAMLERGEPPEMLFRRMAIFCSEDIGNADPQALSLVMHSWEAFDRVGLPEGEYFLAHACIYVAQAPKSNAVKIAMASVHHALEESANPEVPYHLRNAPLKGMAEQGCGKGYVYPHDDPRGVVAGNYFPMDMEPRVFYDPSDRGYEADIRVRLKRIRSIVRSA